MATHGSIYNPVLQSVIGTAGEPFNLRGLARATGLPQNQAYGALSRMLEAGMVVGAGERRARPGTGRGERLYRLAAGPASEGSLLSKVYKLVVELATETEFTTTDIVRRLGKRPSGWPCYSASSVKLVLEMLEMQGRVVRVVEYVVQRGRGRPGRRWTAHPENMKTQQHLAELARRATSISTEVR